MASGWRPAVAQPRDHHFLSHASLIDTPQGVRAITDYNGVNGFGRRPDIVTMNNAHTTHFTDDPEEGITYALRAAQQAGRNRGQHEVSLGHEGTCHQCLTGAAVRPASMATDLHLRHRRSLHRHLDTCITA